MCVCVRASEKENMIFSVFPFPKTVTRQPRGHILQYNVALLLFLVIMQFRNYVGTQNIESNGKRMTDHRQPANVAQSKTLKNMLHVWLFGSRSVALSFFHSKHNVCAFNQITNIQTKLFHTYWIQCSHTHYRPKVFLSIEKKTSKSADKQYTVTFIKKQREFLEAFFQRNILDSLKLIKTRFSTFSYR
jgi:hypothetical protein